MKLESWRARALIEFGFALFRLWVRTLRFQVEDPANILAAARDQPFIFAVWHNRLLLLPVVGTLCFPHRRNVALISASRDGDIVSILVERCGHGTIRGSTSRKGMIALRQLVDALAAGTNVWVTPDGPRGPVYEGGPGVIFLAQKSGVPIVPLHLEYSSYWRLKSWDRFFVPRPFSRVRVIFGAPLPVARLRGAQQFESERFRLQNAMRRLVEQE